MSTVAILCINDNVATDVLQYQELDKHVYFVYTLPFVTAEPPATCPPLRCSSHGKLQPSGTCLCDEGWSGQLCEEGKATFGRFINIYNCIHQSEIFIHTLKFQV